MKLSFGSIVVLINKKRKQLPAEETGLNLKCEAIFLEAKSFGNRYADKYFYVIPGGKMGMFSNLQYSIAHINQAEKLGMIPVADWDHFPSTYNEPYPVGGITNSWNYFFENLSPYSLNDVYLSKNVFFASPVYDWSMGYYFAEGFNFYKIYQKYIKFKPEINSDVEKYYKKLFLSKDGTHLRILGIHARGWEMTIAPGHPFPPTLEQMFKYTDIILEKYNIDKIYLVTEEQEYFVAFIEKYGELVISTPYARTKRGINGYTVTPEPRTNNLYLYGREIILGGLLLSRCTGLLHCGTNVSTFARFDNHGKYEFEYMIFNGVNSTNPFLSKHMWNLARHLPRKYGGLKEDVTITERNGHD